MPMFVKATLFTNRGRGGKQAMDKSTAAYRREEHGELSFHYLGI